MSEFAVSYAQLHSTIFVPGVGNVGPTLELSSATSKVQNMLCTGSLLIVNVKNSIGIKGQAVIPLTNVSNMSPIGNVSLQKEG